jgi:hypothetical protein
VKLHQVLIFVTTCILLIVAMGDLLNLRPELSILLVLVGHLLLIAMVIAILKAPTQSKKKFDDYFYEDWDYKRNNSPVKRK